MAETDSDTDTGADRGPQDRAREGLDHLQAAARELIQAARAMLDVAEDLVNDPEAVASVAATVGALGDLVRHRAGGPPSRPAARPADPADPGDNGAGSGDRAGGGDRDGGQPVERITVM